jgi:radical SAM superfamily enzyme YgiQ (UPF0313 family)
LAANLPSDYECRIIDAPTLQFSPGECLEAVREYRPAVVGISAFSDSLYACKLLADEIKQFDGTVRIVVGGPHANIYPVETAAWKSVDYLLTGFAENSFAALLDALSSNPDNSTLERIPGLWWTDGATVRRSAAEKDTAWDIDSIRRPDRRLLDHTKYFTLANQRKIATMITSRGCPFRCTFCDVFEKKYLGRKTADIVGEVREILDLGIRQIHFFDDCFNLSRQRVVDLCRAFIDNELDFEWSFRGRLEPCDTELAELLYRAGCRRVQMGIEGTDQETIDSINKNIDIAKVEEIVKIYAKAKIETMGYFIIGFPHQNFEDCERSCKKILEMHFDYINMFILIPYPNTKIYKDIIDMKLLTDDPWKRHALDPMPDFKLPRWHPYLERKELEELLNKYYRKFYLSPGFIFSELRRMKNLSNILPRIKMALAMTFNPK